MTAPTYIKTIEQRRAAEAWNDVNSVSEQQKDRYKSRVLSSAALIQTNGLAQMLAFLRTKDDADKKLANQLAIWVKNQLYPDITNRPEGNLDQILRDKDSDTLRLATREALAYLQWLRRFAQAQIQDKASSPTNEGANQ